MQETMVYAVQLMCPPVSIDYKQNYIFCSKCREKFDYKFWQMKK
jgi:hypothetical protein